MKFICNMIDEKIPWGPLKGIVVGPPQATDTQTYSQLIYRYYGIYLEDGFNIEDTFLADVTDDSTPFQGVRMLCMSTLKFAPVSHSTKEKPMDYRDIITSYNPPWDDYNPLWELWDCGYQEERDEDGVLYELTLNQNLYINGELIPPENIKERLDYIFRRTESDN